MILANKTYWGVYNYVTWVFSVLSGITLLKEE
jgi:hypothetical protein